jgi:ubiquinone/menaquinone biosynthesis C-methylase UbiE
LLGFDHFGILAPFYDRLIRFQRAEKIIQLAALPTPGTILDAGGGTGRVAQALVGQAGRVVVADISRGMLLQASQKQGLKTVNSHTEALPFASGTFERIIMVDALHHVCDYAGTARELWRVLKRGGRLVIEEPDIRTLTVKFVALAEKLALMRSHFVSPPKIAALFPYANANTRVEQEGYNAWVIVEKGE